jgi:glucoamylase
MVKAGAGYIIKWGPSSPQERWEEDAGISPSTLATLISALVCAADIATMRGDKKMAKLCLNVADYWAVNVERWTYTTNGSILEGHPEYYIRISAVDKRTNSGIQDPNKGYVQIKNLTGGTERYPVNEIIGGGFLGLVRYGVRRPGDQHVLKTLAVYDEASKVETPRGPGWHRYNHDGYGQKANGDPYDGTGVGRLWPLLTGERGHYEIAAGGVAYKYIRTMEAFANRCALIPEQVWDTRDIPAKHMLIGRPTGSAMPLVWSHAEYIKLLRSARDGIVFDLIAPVQKRYIDDGTTTDVQVWTFKQKLREFSPRRPLRLEVYGAGRLHWTVDNWTTVEDTEMSDAGLGVYVHEFGKGQFDLASTLKFTFYWHQGQRWEGRNFSLVVHPEGLAPSPHAEKSSAEENEADKTAVFEPALD